MFDTGSFNYSFMTPRILFTENFCDDHVFLENKLLGWNLLE